MARRPSWEGHLKLSLVACPASLYPATSSANDIRFHLINPATGNRSRQQVVDPETGEVERKNLVRGFEFEKDRYVLLTDEELRSVRLESTRERVVAIEARGEGTLLTTLRSHDELRDQAELFDEIPKTKRNPAMIDIAWAAGPRREYCAMRASRASGRTSRPPRSPRHPSRP